MKLVAGCVLPTTGTKKTTRQTTQKVGQPGEAECTSSVNPKKHPEDRVPTS